MKTCPVCRSGAFDDAKVCYGCLHPYADGAGAVRVETSDGAVRASSPQPSLQSPDELAVRASARPGEAKPESDGASHQEAQGRLCDLSRIERVEACAGSKGDRAHDPVRPEIFVKTDESGLVVRLEIVGLSEWRAAAGVDSMGEGSCAFLPEGYAPNRPTVRLAPIPVAPPALEGAGAAMGEVVRGNHARRLPASEGLAQGVPVGAAARPEMIAP